MSWTPSQIDDVLNGTSGQQVGAPTLIATAAGSGSVACLPGAMLQLILAIPPTYGHKAGVPFYWYGIGEFYFAQVVGNPQRWWKLHWASTITEPTRPYEILVGWNLSPGVAMLVYQHPAAPNL